MKPTLLIIALYLAISFITMSFNPADWNMHYRFVFSFLFMAVVVWVVTEVKILRNEKYTEHALHLPFCLGKRPILLPWCIKMARKDHSRILG